MEKSVVTAAAAGLIAGAAITFAAFRYAASPPETLDIVDAMQSAHDEHHHESLDAEDRETPMRKSHRPHAKAFPDSAYPTGAAVVAPEDLVDPSGTRRKLSLENNRKGAIIVGVAGASGSGKTSISQLIEQRLTGPVVVSISCDNYYKSLGHDVDSTNYNFDHPGALDFDLLAEQLATLRQGLDVEVPNYCFKTHKRLPTTTRISGRHTDVVILDGIFVLHAENVRNQCDLTIFTAEDLDVCLARRLKRDLVERGRTVESVLSQYVKFVKAGYHQFVAPTMTLADFIIPRARENDTAISMLVRDISRRVDGI